MAGGAPGLPPGTDTSAALLPGMLPSREPFGSAQPQRVGSDDTAQGMAGFFPQTPQGGGGMYRQPYMLTERDLSDATINKIYGESNRHDVSSVDAVINNMLNRVGAQGFAHNDSIYGIATAPKQYTTPVNSTPPEMAQLVRDRLTAIASGSEPDPTGGSTFYRGGKYATNNPPPGPFSRVAAQEGKLVGGNIFTTRENPSRAPTPPGPYAAGTGGGDSFAAAFANPTMSPDAGVTPASWLSGGEYRPLGGETPPPPPTLPPPAAAPTLGAPPTPSMLGKPLEPSLTMGGGSMFGTGGPLGSVPAPSMMTAPLEPPMTTGGPLGSVSGPPGTVQTGPSTYTLPGTTPPPMSPIDQPPLSPMPPMAAPMSPYGTPPPLGGAPMTPPGFNIASGPSFGEPSPLMQGFGTMPQFGVTPTIPGAPGTPSFAGLPTPTAGTPPGLPTPNPMRMGAPPLPMENPSRFSSTPPVGGAPVMPMVNMASQAGFTGAATPTSTMGAGGVPLGPGREWLAQVPHGTEAMFNTQPAPGMDPAKMAQASQAGSAYLALHAKDLALQAKMTADVAALRAKTNALSQANTVRALSTPITMPQPFKPYGMNVGFGSSFGFGGGY
jgi:hypothetical protein